VRSVVLLGGRGARDDRRAKPVASTAQQLTIVVPRGSRPGRLKLVSSVGNVTPKPRLKLLKGRVAPAADTEAGGVALQPGESLFAGSRKRMVLTATLPESGAVEAYEATTGAVVRSWPLPAGPAEVRWNGTVDGVPVPSGRYGLRVAGDTTGRAASTQSAAVPVHDAVFPIRGKHDLGQTETNNFGGGRGHGGQDMFAKCGTPLVAARRGRVMIAKYQEAAGNYVVLQDATGASYVYMHLRDPSPLKADQVVQAGQVVGHVGLTGRTSGCHLHFELWTAPGWYKGGKAIDPLPELRRWDAFR
ncbi:MAG: Peptidase, partial [Solirubrobacterales bacterium]|nr:Peptidase [Solirubrobacterales bacterium]